MNSLIRFRASLNIFSQKSRYFASVVNTSEYTEKPNYPPILDTSYKAKKQRQKQSWHDKIKSIKTVEEKIFEINMPRYYGWQCIMLNEERFPYDVLPFMQHATRTHLIVNEHLPEFYGQHEAASQAVLSLIREQIEEAVVLEFKSHKHKHNFAEEKPLIDKEDDIIGAAVVEQINRVIVNNLSSSVTHLFDCETDYSPRFEAFWFLGGINPAAKVRKSKEQLEWLKDKANDRVDRAVQYIGSPSLSLRSSVPLEPLVEYNSAKNTTYEVPQYIYDPRVMGYTHDHRHGTNIPGFWPGDKQEFGLISYHPRGHILNRPESYGKADNQDALHSQGILNSFGWLLSQANYQGFNTFNDVTYPLVTQTVITNGQKWSFYAYQLNTTNIHGEDPNQNERVNICFGTKEAELFEAIDEDGKLINFNEDVLKHLIQFYLNKPVKRDVEMKPYLDSSAPHIADITDNEKRVWLESRYKHMVANRPRHLLPYEVYHWEKIYKIDHNTRPLEPKRRPFELGLNPYRKRMDEHTPEYIPKKIRPEGPKSRKKWEKTYYPGK